MENKISCIYPNKPTGCIIRIKNIKCFENEIEIKHFFEHLVDICLIHSDYVKNEAYALMHSKQEALHFMKFYQQIFKNMKFLELENQNIEIEILNKEEEKIFWSNIRMKKIDFYICCKKHK
ncbi:conserved Plasmodium protein, unknown function [Plasmodium gallinaceum]|uniref:XRRM domain-containing protein n=1 Tax=Plasmodium gallinaceum TaxID=5849 RepID=A0A1J1GWQ3_PLAGA|nr:conserved Plasmodium protein, unknown function [Plasmodium gallinaceum]CRG95445.1 conserved Plasmodium protein, unknown function [Plasmodium gallinaceum]